MDQIKAMRVFARVADEGSFAGAARALELAPAAVTRIVAALEAHLGARLLNRTTRHVALTEVGRDFLDRVRRIVAEVDDAAAMASAGVRIPSGTVRMLVPPNVSVHRLARHIPRFHAQYPMLTLRLDAPGLGSSASDAYDISVVWAVHALDGECVARRLTQSDVVLCAAPDYLMRRGRPSDPAGLAIHDVLLPAGAEWRREPVFRRVATRGAADLPEAEVPCTPLRVALETPQVDVNYLAALAGLGIAGLPAYMLDDALSTGMLERVLPEWSMARGTLWATMPSRQHLPARTRAVLEFLLSIFSEDAARPVADARLAPNPAL